jgi:hypothetical protein
MGYLVFMIVEPPSLGTFTELVEPNCFYGVLHSRSNTRIEKATTVTYTHTYTDTHTKE